MPFPIVPAIAAATSLIGMGIAKGKDKRQLTQQEKLQNLQIRGQKEMMDYSMQQQYDMWQKTNYKPQLEEMKEAGINPALMYGMGGGGGTTTGSPSGNVTGAEATKGSGREFEEMAGMGMQMAAQMKLLEAQKENIEADTENKKAQTPNTQAGTGNILTDTELKKKDLELKSRGLEDALQKLSGEAVQAVQRGQQEVQNTDVSQATKDDRIKQIKAEAVGAVLKNALTRAQTANTGKETEVKEADRRLKDQELQQNIQKLMIEWKELSIKEREINLKEMLGIGDDDAVNRTMKQVADAIDNIMYMKTGTGKPEIGTKPPTVGGFRR